MIHVSDINNNIFSKLSVSNASVKALKSRQRDGTKVASAFSHCSVNVSVFTSEDRWLNCHGELLQECLCPFFSGCHAEYVVGNTHRPDADILMNIEDAISSENVHMSTYPVPATAIAT